MEQQPRARNSRHQQGHAISLCCQESCFRMRQIRLSPIDLLWMDYRQAISQLSYQAMCFLQAASRGTTNTITAAAELSGKCTAAWAWVDKETNTHAFKIQNVKGASGPPGSTRTRARAGVPSGPVELKLYGQLRADLSEIISNIAEPQSSRAHPYRHAALQRAAFRLKCKWSCRPLVPLSLAASLVLAVTICPP